MNLKFLAPVSRAAGRLLLTVQKHSPELLTAAGLAGGVVTTVLAAKATLTVSSELKPLKKELEKVRQHTDKNKGRDLTRVYLKIGLRCARHYAVPIGIGMLSAGSILAGYGIIHRRNAALVAAYNSLELAYQTYREKVREEYGEEKELELLNKTNHQLAKTKSKNSLDGSYIPAGTARFFDQYNQNFNHTQREMNLYFLRLIQTNMTDLLRVRGFVTLNEVYERLGMEPSKQGMILGWVLGPGRENFIDFGLSNPRNAGVRDFVNGLEEAVLLEFNHHGCIYDLMEER